MVASQEQFEFLCELGTIYYGCRSANTCVTHVILQVSAHLYSIFMFHSNILLVYFLMKYLNFSLKRYFSSLWPIWENWHLWVKIHIFRSKLFEYTWIYWFVKIQVESVCVHPLYNLHLSYFFVRWNKILFITILPKVKLFSISIFIQIWLFRQCLVFLYTAHHLCVLGKSVDKIQKIIDNIKK